MSHTLFREQALAHHARGLEHGDVLRISKRWPHVTCWLLLLAATAAFLLVSLLGIDEFADGPAVVRVDTRRMVTATVPGTVEDVEVRPGQAVEAGAVLVRMYNADEANELERATREFEFELVRMLRDPSNADAKQNLARLRAARDQARNLASARIVRSDLSGYVSDVRVRTGHHVNAGDVLVGLTPGGNNCVSVVAMVPAQYRPMLTTGAKMRFELDGFRYEYTDLAVSDVSTEAVGPAEVQRYLGQERSDAVMLDPGAKVLVAAHLPTSTFESDGQMYRYFDGLTGVASIRVRRETILVTLVPALRSWRIPRLRLPWSSVP